MPQSVEQTPGSQRLTNDDFRKLLMTPRSAPANAPAAPGSIKEAMQNSSSMPPPKIEDKHEARKKRKSFYAKLKKQEDTRMAELTEKYRDRASERRKGENPDYQADDPVSTAQAYRAVAPDLKSGFDAAERRRQMIQESKFLGGDMEHTHLVKGLDYALLQKVRSEIQQKEFEQEQELERLVSESEEKKKEKERKDLLKKEEEEMKFKTKLGRSIYHTVQVLKSRTIERSDMFVPGRMAYVIDLDDDADTDIPTTLMRSVADVPSFELTTTLSTNDIVINKLTQILSYLRQGNRKKNKHKRALEDANEKEEEEVEPTKKSSKRSSNQDDSIYGDIGDYVPSRSSHKHRDHHRESRSSKHDRNSYFDKQDHRESVDNAAPSYRVNKSAEILTKLQQEPEGYAECYPGLEEMNDAIDDSDDEVDYSKMDLGNKKGPIGRWDFDTAEEYSDYMNQKEALPKAAFQYGLKMADGRRSRKHKDKNEKAHLDREWQKIQNIIHKRN
ncbi:protein Red [Anthonomus grandis grandis]|uniref:protein Red n=1 Tax=Anthonomus grandis grandis TaxID=2921223 RepID=UPI00216552BA|nr:protein Red [Anthonomus grandis grandis]